MLARSVYTVLDEAKFGKNEIWSFILCYTSLSFAYQDRSRPKYLCYPPYLPIYQSPSNHRSNRISCVFVYQTQHEKNRTSVESIVNVRDEYVSNPEDNNSYEKTPGQCSVLTLENSVSVGDKPHKEEHF